MELKIAFFIIVICVSNVFATPAYSQVAKVSLNMENKSLEQVMDEIESQSEFYFIFNQKQIDVNRVVNIKEDNKLITDILPELFKGTNVNYAILDRKILLTTDPLENNLLATASLTGQQQNRIIGTVTDKNGPIPGANVVVTGTTLGAITDLNGKFSIEVPQGAKSLTFSFIGMVPQEIIIGTLTRIDVTMTESAIGLDEVVVVGYGTQKKASITGSIDVVKGEKLKESSAMNFSNAMAGRLAGTMVVTRSGEPGNDASTIRIRGSNTLGDNSPLIVIDGIAGRDMDRLNPEDIESVSVLKDASAAIYGAQAANGVILVTTRRGGEGKILTGINVSYGVSTPTVLPKMADAATFAQQTNEIFLYRGQPARYTPEEIQKYKDGSDPWLYPNTDWFAATFKPFTPERKIDFTLQGGSKNLKYFVSAGSRFQDAIYKNSNTNYKQYNFRSNVDATITDNIHLSLDLSGRQEIRNYGRESGSSIYHLLMLAYPNSAAFWPNGLPGPDIIDGMNPATINGPEAGYQKDTRYIMESNIKLFINIPWVKGLSLTTNVALDKSFENEKIWLTPWYLYTWDRITYDENHVPVLVKGQRGLSEPRLTQNMDDGHKTTLNALINYEHSFSDNHHIKALIGSERLTGESMNLSAYRRYFISPVVDQMFAGGDLDKTNNGSGSQFARLNYFGRLNYDYRNKYLAEFVWRYDGSYMFPADKRFGFFPGVSLGWVVSEENFWKNSGLSLMNNFKLRGSLGKTGNDRIEEYQYLSSYGFGSNYTFNQNVDVKSMQELRIPNPEVTWEIANQANIGIDGQLFKGKLIFSGDVFYNLRTNILWMRNASIPAMSGLTLPRENIGEVINRGFEFEVGYRNKTGAFSYDISINGGHQKNKIKFWDETPGAPDYQKSTGHPMNSQLYYEAIGIFKDQAAVDAYPHWQNARPGDIIFRDVNNDGKIDGLDRVMNYRTDLPTFSGGISIDLEFKNFYSGILLQGATGAVMYSFTEWTGLIGNGYADEAQGRWTEDNIDATKPRTRDQLIEYWASQRNTYFLRSTDYMRLKNIEIGYRTPSSINNKLRIDGLRIYLGGLNLFTLTKLTNHDPESNSTDTYPPNKVYNVGMALTF